MKVLLALDDSARSACAIDFVRRVRWPAGSRVVVLHVVEPRSTATAPAGPRRAGARARDTERRRRASRLLAAASGELRDAGIATESRVECGDPRRALLEVAGRERADLLVVGAPSHVRGPHPDPETIVGCLVSHAPCSVLVARSVRDRSN